MPGHSVLLYISTLAPGASASVVGDIARVARIRNRRCGITGLLAFDGISFLQLLEGTQAALSDLLASLRDDRRHVQMQILSFGPAPADQRRRHLQWELGYHFVEDPADALEPFRQYGEQQALTAFARLAADLDVGVGSAVPA